MKEREIIMPQIFNNAVMTDNGRALLSKEIAGECMIQITRMSIGSGAYTAAEKDPNTLQKMTALKNEMQSTGLSSLKRQDNISVIVTGIFTNDNLETAYNINEIGLYAQEKGNRSTEILYSVAVIAEEQGEIMPASEGKNPVRIIQDWVVTVANSANATIEYLPDGAFAMASQVGNVDDLNTKAKENLVDAANELLENTIANNKKIEALENPNFKEAQDDEDPEKAIEQIIPGKAVLELYKYIKSALKGILVIAKKALNIATGKNQARVFTSVADLDAWLAVPDNTKKLNVGDNFYIVATDVPDYWWDGIAKQELEVQKIDLTTYDNAIKALQKEDEKLKQSVKLEALSTNNIIDVLTTINQITSIGFWKINSIDGDYAQSIGIRPADNVGDFYAIVSNYNGDGVNHFAYGNLQLFSPRLGVNYFTIQVWDENATARCMITHDNLLNTTEQISANTESFFATGALAAKAMMADYNNKINQINSNMMNKGNFIDAWISKNIKIGGADDADYPASVNNQIPFDNYHKTGESFTLLPDGSIQCNRAGTVIAFLQIVDTPELVGMNLIYKLSSRNAPYSHEKRFGFRPTALSLRATMALNVYTVQNGTIITCEAVNYTAASNVIINGITPYNTRIMCILY